MKSRAEIEREIEIYKTREIAISKIKKAGLPIPTNPEDHGIIKEWEDLKKQFGGINNIPFHYLGEFLDRWTQMLSYARWVEAVADIELTTAEEIRNTIKKQLYTLMDGPREMKDASVYHEPLYVEWEKKYLEAATTLTLIKALRESYEYKVNAISREITRRGDDVVDIRKGINRGNTP